jgi:hypothetical protein
MTKAIVKKGPPRKSRRKRLPVSSMGAWPRFEPSESDWTRIAAAYPYFGTDDRAHISKLANEYLYWEGFERSAPFLDDAMAWLKKARKAAKAFSEALDEGGDAVFYTRHYVATNMRHHLFEPEGPLDWSGLSSLMTFFRGALVQAETEIPKEARVGLVEGECWEMMVRKLTDYAESQGYPTGASKGVDKTVTPNTSDFVALVREIQNTFPPERRRHTASDVALAQAISEARRKRRKAKSAGAGI